MIRQTYRTLTVIASMLAIAIGPMVAACPFCESVQQTIRQQSETMDAVVIASCLDGESTRNLTTGVVKMKVEKVLKGGQFVKAEQTVDAIYFGKVEVGRRFLLSGVDPPNLQWSCLPVNEKSEDYIVKATEVEDDPVARLRFFRKYLENEDPLISRDAYDEFASAPYDVISKIGPEMDRKQLIDWVKQPEMGVDRKRLYFTMLGVCGDDQDIPMLEEMLKHPTKSGANGLDALIACYLTLAGEKGLPLIEELYIANKKAEFSQTYAAIMALRFHGTEGKVIPRSALAESMHKILEREQLADMVIPDLAKWQDWSQIDRLSKLFKEVDPKDNWLRVPVINYMRACPLPAAAEALEEFEKIDPEAVRRAKAFFPAPIPVRPKSSESSTSQIDSSELQPPVASTPLKPRTGERYAAALNPSAAPVPALVTRQNDLSEPSNPWEFACVLMISLASLVITLFLVLTGGSIAEPKPEN
ncbi:hypothetical protein LOC67_01130 [Stieleria sp. JC731]|uniref:hypothetical protein n=1 Tax=Pirellulaceae TaxID=2691357 RepID=UPI001E63C720|nr:hypothetical protein [Stieleria sp. JC731]MCC9599144.1 hypothetical protein [Stieleria sp. JC731]